MALGFAVLDAARFSVGPSRRRPTSPRPPRDRSRRPVRGGRPAVTSSRACRPRRDVAERGRAVAASTRVWFLVDSLDHLRRGGRLSMPATALGIVLGLRPILTIEDGGIEVVEKVRTRRAARDRLVALARRRHRPHGRPPASPCTTWVSPTSRRRWPRSWRQPRATGWWRRP